MVGLHSQEQTVHSHIKLLRITEGINQESLIYKDIIITFGKTF